MQQKTIDKYKRVMERIKGGETMDAAVRAEQMGTTTFYEVKKHIKSGEITIYPDDKVENGKKIYKKKKPSFVDIPLKTENSKVVFVVCEINQIKEVLGSLA